MAETVNIRNEITGRVGKIPVKLYNSSAFNKDDVWILYDGSLRADCGCNGQSTTEIETPTEEEVA